MKESRFTKHEKDMYMISFSVLAICLLSLLFLSGIAPVSILKGSITGAVVGVETRNLTPIIDEEKYVDYENISFENITQKLALNAILQAQTDMEEMQENGFGISWVNDTLIEAKRYFEGENYTSLLREIEQIDDRAKRAQATQLLITAQKKIGVSVDYQKVLEKTKAINDRKAKAYEINDLVRAEELRIKDFEKTGLEVTAPLELLDKAKIEFEEERYDDAISLLAGIEPKIDEIKSENTIVKTIYRAGKDNIASFLKEHWIELSVFLSLILLISVLFYNRIMIAVLKRQVKDMTVEKEVLLDLMKKSQRDYFEKGAIPKQTFEIKISRYKEMMAKVKQKLPVAESLLNKRLQAKRII